VPGQPDAASGSNTRSERPCQRIDYIEQVWKIAASMPPAKPTTDRTTTEGSNKSVTPTRKRQPDLDKSLAELEAIVETLEEGDLPLEKALQQFEKGIKLSRDCQAALTAAEQKVQILMQEDLQDFEAAGDEND
jgi:exodeoxyribonuclease VII small subunit